MCIIVAKPSKVSMPSDSILSNCFSNNPDGAGIMLSAKGKVYGFKGLMTYDAFKAKLKQLEKRFGSLNKLNVVMHFRIKTHGSAIAANTHPFPVSSSYKVMRKLEWTSSLGVAHNGIIGCTEYHPDIKKENVSDTMVFIKRVITPVASASDIMDNPDLLDALQLAADSKLAFLDKSGLQIRGNFTYKDGVYYSNSSFEDTYFPKGRYYGVWDHWTEYDIEPKADVKKGKIKQKEELPVLSQAEEDWLMEETASEEGLEILAPGFTIVCDGFNVSPNHTMYAIDTYNKLYYWDIEDYVWTESSYNDSILGISFDEVEVDA